MANRRVSNRSAEEFVAALAEQTCFLQCNPSSLHQVLVFGSENSAQHTAELEASKRHCVKGCALAYGKPMQAAVASSLIMRMDDEIHHSKVLNKAEKQRIIEQQHALCDKIKAACVTECSQYCKTQSPKQQTSCAVDCATGCRAFLKTISYTS